MPTLPVASQTDVTLQSTTTGVVDYLKFVGPNLVASNSIDYGIGSDWKVVASGNFNGTGGPDLLTQSASTGQVDFLFLDANGKLVSSGMSAGALPRIVGVASDIGAKPGQIGQTLVSQLSDGSLDLLGFDGTGKLIGSQMIAGTAGLAQAKAVIAGAAAPAPFKGAETNDGVVTQLSNGQIDLIGLSGSFGNGSVTFSASFLSPSSSGLAPVGAANPDFATNFNISDSASHEGIQLITQDATGAVNAAYLDSGLGNSGSEGLVYSSERLGSFGGWSPVDGGVVAHSSGIFPIT